MVKNKQQSSQRELDIRNNGIMLATEEDDFDIDDLDEKITTSD